jgi:hypothetical protein
LPILIKLENFESLSEIMAQPIPVDSQEKLCVIAELSNQVPASKRRF